MLKSPQQPFPLPLPAGAPLSMLFAVATHPLTHYALAGFVSLLLGLLLRRHARARAMAQAFADYLEAIERQAVLAAELAGFVRGLKGYDKLLFALDYVEARLAEQGIVGDPDRVTRERLMADLTALKDELFPGKGTVLGHLVKRQAE
ncbi:hypothetical protein D3C72_772770 [compost metagenome]